jgi:hypothetical protein
MHPYNACSIAANACARFIYEVPMQQLQPDIRTHPVSANLREATA